MTGKLTLWAASVLAACIIGAAWIYTHPSPRMVRVDAGSLLEEQRKSLSDKIRPNMPEDEQQALLRSAGEHARDLDDALKMLARECGCAVVNSAAILALPESASAGIPDMTGWVRTALRRRY